MIITPKPVRLPLTAPMRRVAHRIAAHKVRWMLDDHATGRGWLMRALTSTVDASIIQRGAAAGSHFFACPQTADHEVTGPAPWQSVLPAQQ